MNRRQFLVVAGGGVVLAAGAGTTAIALRKPHKALEPWSLAGGNYKEPRRRALSYAILAPNPHNRQPWMVDLSQPDTVILNVDTQRLLPHTDPFSRQITIGLGCFLEVMRMAAAEDGYKVALDLFPEGWDEKALDRRPVAVAHFAKDKATEPDPLFAHILQRRSLKEPYRLDKPVGSEILQRIKNAAIATNAHVNNDETHVVQMRKLTREALKIEIETPRTYKESVDLFRIGKSEVEANPDGIDFSGPFFEVLGFTGLFSRKAALDRSSATYKQGEAAVLQNAETAMAHLWQVTPTNTREDQINAGTDWVRINLAATAEGVGIHPLSQALQEYAEMAALYNDVHSRLAPQGGTVQMLARLGYADPAPQSPRWPLEAKIMKE